MTRGFDTEERLRSAFASKAFTDAVRPLTLREQQRTTHITQRALREAIRILSPARALEIGTYFGDTTRELAEFMAEQGEGHITTIDPFGAHRAPDLIGQWPEGVREHVTFLPDNSMTFFAELEIKRAGVGENAPFDVIYIDGNHAFEFAFFDLMRSARYLRPGGAIFVDNVDQAGPREAVHLFCQRHGHWRLFAMGGGTQPGQWPQYLPGSGGALLLAPDGIEVGTLPYKFNLYNLPRARVDRLTLRPRNADITGYLAATINFFVKPLDEHITGRGVQSRLARLEQLLQPSRVDEVALMIDPPLEVTPLSPDDPIHAEIEVRFVPVDASPQLLLDTSSPLTLD